MKLREFKHSYTTGDRVLTLLCYWKVLNHGHGIGLGKTASFDSYDQFVANGQHPVR